MLLVLLCIWSGWTSSFLPSHLSSLSFPMFAFTSLSLTLVPISLCMWVPFSMWLAPHLWTLPASQGRCLHPSGSALHSSFRLPQPCLLTQLVPPTPILLSSCSVSLLLWDRCGTCSLHIQPRSAGLLPARAQQQYASAADSSPAPSIWLLTHEFHLWVLQIHRLEVVRVTGGYPSPGPEQRCLPEGTWPLTLFSAWKPSLLCSGFVVLYKSYML